MAQDLVPDEDALAKSRAKVRQQLLGLALAGAFVLGGFLYLAADLKRSDRFSSTRESSDAALQGVDDGPGVAPRPADFQDLAVPPQPTVLDASGPPVLNENLLLDPSFEDADPRDANWVFYDARLAAEAQWSYERARTGSHALKVRNGIRGKQGFPMWQSGKLIPVQPGHSYVLSAWAYSPDGGAASIGLQHYGERGPTGTSTSNGCRNGYPATGRWERLHLSFVADLNPSARHVQPRLMQCTLYLAGDAQTVYFDDVFFGAVDDEPCPQAPCESLKRAHAWTPD